MGDIGDIMGENKRDINIIKGFNEKKYSSAFPYFSEICKRGIAAGLNTIYQKKYNQDLTKKKFDISDVKFSHPKCASGHRLFFSPIVY